MKRPAPAPSLRRCSLAELEAQITELAGQLRQPITTKSTPRPMPRTTFPRKRRGDSQGTRS
jgi:hypothetical protein